jgi:hypothetical protein
MEDVEENNPSRISRLLKWRPNFKLIWDKIRTWLIWRPSFKLSKHMALITGITMGVLAAVVQGYFGVQPPAGEGICAISHPADLVNWVVDKIFNTKYVSHDIFATVPVLTSVGFIIGSFAAAVRNKEFKFRRGPVRDNMLAFILGFVIINVGMLWGSCPIRTTVLASYGMWFAVLILGMIVLGVVTACLYIKWKVRRAK